MKSLVSCALILCSVAGAGYALAQRSPADQLAARRAGQVWEQELQSIDHLLEKGESQKAYQKASKLLNDMRDRLVGNQAAAPLVGRALIRRAVAAYDHDVDEAIWHWQAAQQLWPGMGASELLGFGPTGKALSEGGKYKASEPAEPSPPGYEAPQLTPPEPLQSPQPKYGRPLLAAPFEITVEVMIDREGKTREPRVVGRVINPVLANVVLDAMRRWRFKPGEVHGQETEVMMQWTFSLGQ